MPCERNLTYPSIKPTINSLSLYQNPAGQTTLIAISGENFVSYSRVLFGAIYPQMYFINSTLLQFYVPNEFTAGTYTLLVTNGSDKLSNIISYNITMANGYWQYSGTSGNITNSNSGGVKINTWFGKPVPNVITTFDTSYNIADTDNYIIVGSRNNISTATLLMVMPTGNQYDGRELFVKKINGTGQITVKSTSSVITAIDGSLTDVILNLTGKTCMLVYNQGYWEIMQTT